jgi:hypothetical protein
MDPNVTFQRVLRLARLDTSVFDEVRDDARELVPSVVVAAVSCILAGIGAFLWWKVVPDTSGDPDGLFVNTVILGSVFLFAAYYIGAGVAWLVLSQMYRVQSDAATIMRTVGYGAIPLAASVLMFIPVLWPVFSLAPLGLVFVMIIYAVQSATNAESNQTVMASGIGFVALVLVAGVIATIGDFDEAPMGAGQFGILFDFN